MSSRTYGSLIFILFVVLATSVFCDAQPGSAVRFSQQKRVFRIDAGEMTYAFGVNEKSELQSIYWGGRLGDDDAIPSPKAAHEVTSFDSPGTTTLQEFSGWGGGIYVEPALKVSFPDGNRDLVLHYDSETTTKEGFIVVLKDISRDIFVELHYTVDEATGILGRSAFITNRTKQPLTIEQAAAANWNLPSGADYSLRYLSGRWAAEDSLNQQQILPGKTVLESRRGSTGHQNNPWFAIERGNSMEEDTGEVWFGALASIPPANTICASSVARRHWMPRRSPAEATG
jgi:alpha-galactosidase